MLSSSDQSVSDHCDISNYSKSDSLQNQKVDLLSDDNKINPLSNFSIRDFVFNRRSKDIGNNWPFSKKSLQLCMKHEMKNVLPHFCALDSMKNNPIMASHAVENPNLKLSREVHRKLDVDIENIKCSEPPEDKIKITSLPIQSQVKKHRLIVKLRNIPEQKSTKELPETMASKVCPVCKSFTSSSNTTLNAHIDQCLSGEPVVEGSKSLRVIKHHRIKPRKIRFMVDIYAAALECSLEDLDRRNGTNWASNSCTAAVQDQEMSAEEKKKTCSSGKMEEVDVNSDMYFDSKGKKLRILSKLSVPPIDDCGPMNVVKEDARTKTISSIKKKYVGHEHKLLSGPAKVDNGHQRNFTPQEGHKRKNLPPSLNRNDQIKYNALGMSKHLVGSKLTGQKKMILEPKNQKHSIEITKKKGASHLNSPLSTDMNPLLRKRKENSSHIANDASRDMSRLRKRVSFSSLDSKDVHGKKNHVFSDCNAKRLRKDGHFVHEKSVDPPNSVKNQVPSQKGNKLMSEIHSSARNLSGTRMSDHHSFPSRGKELSGRHSSLTELKKSCERKHLDFKKSKLHGTSRLENEAIKSLSATHRQDNTVEPTGESSVEKEKQHIIQSPNMDFNVPENSPVNYNIVAKDVQLPDETICEPTSKIVDGEDFMAFGKSLSSAYEEQHPDAMVEMGDANEEKGDYFLDVDPIPIPGPPGSFLPSPGRMSSEEPHGNSSLTIQSLGNDHELVLDMDSPSSNVSDFAAVRSDSISFMNLPVSMESNGDNSEYQTDHAVENSTSLKLPETTTLELEIGKLGRSSKGKDLQIGPFNYQDSHLLMPCTMPSLALPAQENVQGNKLPACLNLELPSPTIRLMGKNLTVGNKEENLSPSTAINGISTGSFQKESNSFHHISSQANSVFESMQNNMPPQQSGFSPSDIQEMHPVCISTSVPVGYGVNPFYSYQTRGYLPCGGYNMLHNVNIPVPHQHGVNISWDRTHEGSSHLLHPNPLSSFLRPIGDPRYLQNFPTGFM